MLTIEIHGINHAEQSLLLTKRIVRLLKTASYASLVEIEETVKGSRVYDLQYASRPYLRLAGTQSFFLQHLPDLIWRLRSLEMRIDLLILAATFSTESLAEMTEEDQHTIAREFARKK